MRIEVLNSDLNLGAALPRSSGTGNDWPCRMIHWTEPRQLRPRSPPNQRCIPHSAPSHRRRSQRDSELRQ